MSRLDELIQQLCPNGVEFYSLGKLEDLGKIKLGRGNVISKKEIQECPGEFPVYSSAATNNGMIGRYGKYMFDDERLSWSIDGGGRFFYRNCEKYSITNVGGWLKVFDPSILTRFLYHALSNEWSRKSFDYIHKAHPSVLRDEYIIPVPPLEVQREIVRILDNFTELTAELTAELAARKKQYEYYRDELLNFSNAVPTQQLRDLVEFRNGKGHEKDIVPCGKFIVVNSKFISTQGEVKKFSNKQICPLYTDDILMVMSDLPNGRALAKCYLVETNELYTLNQRIGAFRVKDFSVVNTKFLYYVLNRNQQLLKYDNGVDQTNLKKDDILNIDIPVPPLTAQKRIVNILDRFDTLCNDISAGLPAEIEARQKQYEYYRDKLLTFKEKKNAAG